MVDTVSTENWKEGGYELKRVYGQYERIVERRAYLERQGIGSSSRH